MKQYDLLDESVVLTATPDDGDTETALYITYDQSENVININRVGSPCEIKIHEVSKTTCC